MREKRKERERERERKKREDKREGSAQMGPRVRFMMYTNKNRQTKRLIKVYDERKNIYIYKQKKEEPCQEEPQV